jgi:hypothetical protein
MGIQGALPLSHSPPLPLQNLIDNKDLNRVMIKAFG